jgi:hypothetical protein
LYSVGNNEVTVQTKNSGGIVIDTQTFQNIDVGGPGPIENGWGQTDFYTFTGPIRTVNITSSQVTPLDGYGIDDVLVEFSSIDVEKSWTHTDYNWDPVCADFFNETSKLCQVAEFDLNPGSYRPANINATEYPEDDVLANPLDQDGNGNYTAFAQIKKSKFSNTNPGAFYALTTVNVTSSLDSMTVDEIFDDCTESGKNLLKFVSKNPTRNVKVAVANATGFVTELTDSLYDEIGGNVTANIDNATVNITDPQYLTEGSTVFVLVKFQDNLKGEEATDNEFDQMCDNIESVTARIGDGSQTVDAEAALRITNQFP